MSLLKKSQAPKKAKEVKAKKKSGVSRNFILNFIIVLILAASFMMLLSTLNSYKEVVSVVGLKNAIGNNIITSDNLKKIDVSKNNFDKDMILWEERTDAIVDKYPSMQIRPNTPVYKDMITEEQILRYSYLYDLKPNEEVVTFLYNPKEAGGRIPIPGDRFRIRASYKMSDKEVEAYNQAKNPTGTQGSSSSTDGTWANAPNETSGGTQVAPTVPVTTEETVSDVDLLDYISGDTRIVLVFDVVTVVDMLNSDGDSIFEIIRATNSLPKAEKDKLIADEQYKSSITPTSMLIIADSSQVTRHAQFSSATGIKYTITVLSRDENLKEEDIKLGNSILDSIGD